MNDNLIQPIEFEEYDRISDDVLFLSKNIVFRFSVSLSGKDKDGNRTSFHKEFQYYSKDANRSLITIKRSYDYYLSFENFIKTEEHDKEFIRIGLNEYGLLLAGLEEVHSWFTSKQYESLFAMKNGKLIMTSTRPEYKVVGLPFDKYIKFEPTVIQHNGENDREMGVTIYLSSEKNYADLTLNKFMALYYVYKSFNMYQSAQEMINYIGRPENGFNLINFSNDNYNKEQQNVYIPNKVPEGRVVHTLNNPASLDKKLKRS